jgi:hypothetical protein
MNHAFLIPTSLRSRLSGRNARLVDQLGGAVAHRCRASLWRRTCRQAETMSVAEIRGYVRAHALPLVEPEVDAEMADQGIDQALRGRLIESAVERLIAMTIHDVFSHQPTCETKMIAA